MDEKSLRKTIKEMIVKEFMAISMGAGSLMPTGQIAGGPALPIGMGVKIPKDIKKPAGKKRRKKKKLNEANSVLGMTLATWGVDVPELLFGSAIKPDLETETQLSDGDETNIPNNKSSKYSKSNAHKINPNKDKMSDKKHQVQKPDKSVKTSSNKESDVKLSNPFYKLMWSGDLPIPNPLKVKYVVLENTIKENEQLLGKVSDDEAVIHLDQPISEQVADALNNFLQFCQAMLNIKTFPEIYILSERLPGMTTGAYLPSKKVVLALAENRLMIDVFRTIAHELTHCKQHERGELDNLPPRQDEDDMSDVNTSYENEAYMNSGNFSKAWARLYKNMTRDEIFSMTM
jgi:hypothetical protein